METKRCPQCGLDLPVSKFSNRSRPRQSQLQAYCDSCRRKRDRESIRTSSKRRESRRRSRAKLLERNSRFLNEYLVNNPCVICGGTDARVMEFHHRDPSAKEFNVSNGVRCGFSLDRIAREIEKCDVMCANCHRIEHHELRKQQAGMA